MSHLNHHKLVTHGIYSVQALVYYLLPGVDHVGQVVDKQCNINIPKWIHSKKQNQYIVRSNSKIQNIITNTNQEVNYANKQKI
jgi:hypothetical protein